SPADEEMSMRCPPLSLTIPEVRHLLAHLLWPPPRSAILVLSWSCWRRCHQSRACYFHTKRRCAAQHSRENSLDFSLNLTMCLITVSQKGVFFMTHFSF